CAREGKWGSVFYYGLDSW
nr:immunoglobulin heavy chain junction region [Macaca mulatta]MPN70656.1 immunoglobulin heavy chain junction region [Macaca mulatta]MPN71012.1 immunoglobulin heavy chain junction region [Macaca mulatta]MPN71394.1 immunoglobulin heavy chain junction region [Macaca mulatta]MPN71456.1 immunoglobulin heavy chain junction region [Macaca mulatta]